MTLEEMSPEMTPEVKAQWLADLRSGAYKQWRSSLYHEDAFCCLGVLSHRQGLLDEPTGRYPDKFLHAQTQAQLIKMNDEQCLSFPQIADWIEENI
jgi:hypothetical protein